MLIVITSHRLQMDLQQQATHDPLTNVFNRRALITLAERDIARSNRRGTLISVLMIDADHFKKINDTYGHIIGDEVLIMVTRLLSGAVRNSDLLYRYGGEEFVAIIAANDLESATQVFERARAKIEQFEFPQVGHVTISGGFSCADTKVLPQEVINRADSSLYAAKNAGRNRIYYYDTLIKEGILKEEASGSIVIF